MRLDFPLHEGFGAGIGFIHTWNVVIVLKERLAIKQMAQDLFTIPLLRGGCKRVTLNSWYNENPGLHKTWI